MRTVVLSIVAFAVCLLTASLAAAQATQPPLTLAVSVPQANMRDKPSLSAAVVAVLASGEQLEVLETTGAWFRVRVKSTGKIGYVNYTVVKPAGTSDLAAWMDALRLATPGGAAPPGAAPPPAAEPPAAAAQPTGRPRAPAAKEHPGFHAFGIVDVETMTASKSFTAVLDSGKATVTNVGFGVEATHLWKGLFARVAYTHSSNPGMRVFVDSSLVAHSLSNPLTIEITPIEVGAGWLFGAPPPKGKVGVRPYAGAALLLQRYKETSSFAGAGEDTDTTDKGFAAFGGLEVSIRFVRIGVEGQFRSVPNAIGAGGASLAYNETNLGGGVFRLTFGVGF
jgi:hypothetical protein